jgi:glucose/arabinose dehydrogenase
MSAALSSPPTSRLCTPLSSLVRRAARACRQLPLGFTLSLAACLLPTAAAASELPLEQIRLPPGFSIELLARVPNARQMALSPANVLYVGSMRAGKVHALPLDADYRPGRLRVVADRLKMPSGVAWHDGSLYVAAVDRIVRLDDIDRSLDTPPKPAIVRDDLPRETHHGWKFIAFGPDGWLYVPVGAPCNICEPDPDRYAAILRMRPDGSQLQPYARGVRNSLGFDWHPATGT